MYRMQQRYFVMVFIFLMNLFPYSNDGAQDSAKEENLKAVMIYNFTKFMKWPQESSIDQFNIYVMEGNNIIHPLQNIAKKRDFRGKNIVIKEVKDVRNINGCCILILNEVTTGVLQSVLDKAIESNTLVISNSIGFCEKGVPVNFVKMEDKIRFEINVGSLKKINIQTNTQLLNLAVKIYTD